MPQLLLRPAADLSCNASSIIDPSIFIHSLGYEHEKQRSFARDRPNCLHLETVAEHERVQKKTHFPMFNKLNCGFISLCLEFSSAVCCWTNIGNRERTGRRILDKSRRRALGPTNNKAFKMFLGAFHWMRKFSAISERPTECTGLLCFATSRHLKASLLTSLS